MSRVSGALLLLLAACADRAAGPAGRPDVLLVTVDTLRADHVGAYAAGARTPALDRLAESGTVFENAFAPMPMTRPSHATMLTSLLPREHGVLNNALVLPAGVPTLPELLAGAGYATGGFVAVKLLDESSGQARGFQVFASPEAGYETDGEEVVDRALAWLEGADAGRPLFAWVHLFDPHLPYAPRAEDVEGANPALLARLPKLGLARLFQIAEEDGGDVPLEVLEHALALYQGEVVHVDRQVGRLVEAFRRRSPGGLVLFTADHGESFEDGVWFEHSDSLGAGAIEVPLIAVQPGVFPAGERRRTPAGGIDVAPTVLAACGVKLPAGFSGTPLQDLPLDAERHLLVQLPVHAPERAAERASNLQQIRSVGGEPVLQRRLDAEVVALVDREHKLVQEEGGRRLFARVRGPGGVRDEERSAPAVADGLGALLERLLAEHPFRPVAAGELTDELKATLRALGYAY